MKYFTISETEMQTIKARLENAERALDEAIASVASIPNLTNLPRFKDEPTSKSNGYVVRSMLEDKMYLVTHADCKLGIQWTKYESSASLFATQRQARKFADTHSINYVEVYRI